MIATCLTRFHPFVGDRARSCLTRQRCEPGRSYGPGPMARGELLVDTGCKTASALLVQVK